MRRVDGRLSHSRRVLRRCHPEKSLCSSEFSCRSFIKHKPSTVCFLIVKKSACFYELRFGRISLNKSFSFYIRDFKTIKVSNSTGRLAYQFVRSCRLLNLLFDIFDSFSVLFNQSYYLNHFDKDSNWIIVACFMRA